MSVKCKKPIGYRSGWERAVCLYLDSNPQVTEYFYEEVIIPYLSNTKSTKIRKYFPDFIVVFKDGTKKMIEVKRQNQVDNIRVQKKATAAIAWCARQNPPMTYEFWTDPIVLPLVKAFKDVK